MAIHPYLSAFEGAERRGDEPRLLLASASIALFGVVRHSHCRRHLSRTMNDSQHLDVLRMDAVHKPILPHEEFSNRRVVVLRNPAAAFGPFASIAAWRRR